MQQVNGPFPACFACCLPRPALAPPKEYSSASAAAISGTSLPQRCGSLAFRSDDEGRATSKPASASSVSQLSDSLLLGSAAEGGECASGRASSTSLTSSSSGRCQWKASSHEAP